MSLCRSPDMMLGRFAESVHFDRCRTHQARTPKPSKPYEPFPARAHRQVPARSGPSDSEWPSEALGLAGVADSVLLGSGLQTFCFRAFVGLRRQRKVWSSGVCRFCRRGLRTVEGPLCFLSGVRPQAGALKVSSIKSVATQRHVRTRNHKPHKPHTSTTFTLLCLSPKKCMIRMMPWASQQALGSSLSFLRLMM